MTPSDLLTLRTKLISQRLDLRARLSRDSLQVESLPDPLDQAILRESQDQAARDLEANARILSDIEYALSKDGDFGICEGCDSEIPFKRLNIIPWARFCIHCQEVQES